MSLSVENLSFAYGKKSSAVLQGISCAFEPGRFYGIFGANGSGKSTLLKVFANLLHTDCKVDIDGRILQELSSKERARLLAFAAQENEYNLPFSARECIKLGRYAWSDVNEELIDRLIDEWNARHLAEKNFNELSGGEQQKIKLLRILAQDTPYILLDEPGSSLDWTRQIELYKKLQMLAHQWNKCVIMVCHDVYLAPSFIDRMLVLAEGRLIYNGEANGAAAAGAVTAAFGQNFTLQRNGNQVVIQWQDQAE